MAWEEPDEITGTLYAPTSTAEVEVPVLILPESDVPQEGDIDPEDTYMEGVQ